MALVALYEYCFGVLNTVKLLCVSSLFFCFAPDDVFVPFAMSIYIKLTSKAIVFVFPKFSNYVDKNFEIFFLMLSFSFLVFATKTGLGGVSFRLTAFKSSNDPAVSRKSLHATSRSEEASTSTVRVDLHPRQGGV